VETTTAKDKSFSEVFNEVQKGEAADPLAEKPAAPAVTVEDEGSDEDGEETSPAAEATAAAVPDWAIVPPTVTLPKGRIVFYIRFRPEWTDVPGKGERQCILWNLTEADEKLAIKRTRGEALRTIDELTKQMIRVVDGVKSDWTGVTGAGSVSNFWTEIGGKCRQLLKNIYLKNHSLAPEETADFFGHCIAAKTVDG